MQALSTEEKAAEQERRRRLAVDLNHAMCQALEGKGPVPSDTVRYMLFALESLTKRVRDDE